MTVIFPDRNISPSHFRDEPERTLVVSTIFYTIQGEGPLAGHPAVFLRLAGCNLGAKGISAAGCQFCDTDFRIDRGKRMTFEEIEREAWLARNAVCRDAPKRPLLFVITGGEPTLQRNLLDFVLWTKWRVQIETNGMYPIKGWVRAGVNLKNMIVVSPKLGAAKRYPKLKDEVLNSAECLKFVLECDQDSGYFTVPDYAMSFKGRVYVSPMAVYKRAMTTQEGERASIWDHTLIDEAATARNYRYAAEYAARHNLLLSVQTHLFCSIP